MLSCDYDYDPEPGDICWQGPPRASWFMCFECGWRYLALVRHGYAVDINADMRQLTIEHDDLAEQGLPGCR